MSTTDPTTESPLLDLTAFQRDILSIVSKLEDIPDRECYGLAIKAELEEYYGEVNHGRLYPNLDQLADAGMLKKGQIDRRTNKYRLTERGQRDLEADAEWRSSNA